MLLNTYSPYLKLAPEIKEALFAGLKTKIERDFGGTLELSYIGFSRSSKILGNRIGLNNFKEMLFLVIVFHRNQYTTYE